MSKTHDKELLELQNDVMLKITEVMKSLESLEKDYDH